MMESSRLLLVLCVGLALSELCVAQAYPRKHEPVRCYGKLKINQHNVPKCKLPRADNDVKTFYECCRSDSPLVGKAFILANDESGTCQLCPEKVHGSWAEWSDWSFCSRRCGGGTWTRTRSCTNPSPLLDGRLCRATDRLRKGYEGQRRRCNTHPCPVAGGWTDWSTFSQCSVTCGIGEQVAMRNCSNPAPQFGGAPCQGPSKQVRICRKEACIVEAPSGYWGPWEDFSACTTTCGLGTKTRRRRCTRTATDRILCLGPIEETHYCLLRSCLQEGDITCSAAGRRSGGSGSGSGKGSGESEDGSAAGARVASGAGNEDSLLESDDEDFNVDYHHCCRQRNMTYNERGSCCRRISNTGSSCSGNDCELGSGGSGSGSGSGAFSDASLSGSGDSGASLSGSGDSNDGSGDIPRKRSRQHCQKIREANPAGRRKRDVLSKNSNKPASKHAPVHAKVVPAVLDRVISGRSRHSEDHMDDDYSDDDLIFVEAKPEKKK